VSAPHDGNVERLDLRVDASAQALSLVRRRIAAFARRHALASPEDVALAVTEAATNAIVHAYRGDAEGDMRIVACAEPTGLVVVVRDYGCGMSPNPESPGAGLGLSVIGALAAELNVERPDGGGTRIRIRFPPPQAVAA
jgi:serine/threonine-protein kinase RsbW/stage II sporulation protein AB (anti-sigma F factor)